MHTTVKYTGSRAENEKAAQKDVIFYVGGKREYNKKLKLLRAWVEGIRHCGGTVRDAYRAIRTSLDLYLGIRGYWPVRAVMRDVLSK